MVVVAASRFTRRTTGAAVKFSRDPPNELTIRRIDRGGIRIGDRQYVHSVAITTDEVIDDVSPPAAGDLAVADLEPLLSRQPEILVVGTGWHPARPPRELVFALARRGIGLEIMDTPAACRTFNILLAEGRRPAALLIMD